MLSQSFVKIKLTNVIFFLALPFAACTPKNKFDEGSLSNSPLTNSTVSSSAPFKNQVPIDNRISGKVDMAVSNLNSTNNSGSIQIVAWLDPEEPFSARTYSSLRSAAKSNPKISLSIRFKTNPSNPLSRLKARYIYAAVEQGKLFDVADIMFNGILSLKSEAALQSGLKEIGLDMAKLMAQLALPSIDSNITADESALAALGSAVAPSVYINGVRIYDFEVQSPAKVAETISKVGG